MRRLLFERPCTRATPFLTSTLVMPQFIGTSAQKFRLRLYHTVVNIVVILLRLPPPPPWPPSCSPSSISLSNYLTTFLSISLSSCFFTSLNSFFLNFHSILLIRSLLG